MANLHRAREMIVAAYVCDILDDVEFILLHDMHTPTNVDFQHENDDYRFDLDKFNDDECSSYFRLVCDEANSLDFRLVLIVFFFFSR